MKDWRIAPRDGPDLTDEVYLNRLLVPNHRIFLLRILEHQLNRFDCRVLSFSFLVKFARRCWCTCLLSI